MAHPFNKIRANNVSRKRVGELTDAYSNGTQLMSDESPVARVRADRPMRASGGRVKAGTTVNIIVQGKQPDEPPAPPMMPPPPPAPPPGPPPGGPPGMGAGPPMPPGGGMGPPPMRARGGAVKSVGMDVGTKVSHDKGINNELKRPNTVTFRARGGVVTFKTGGGPKLPGGAGGGKGRLKKAAMTHKGSQV